MALALLARRFRPDSKTRCSERLPTGVQRRRSFANKVDDRPVPRGTDHRFAVTSPICRALNGYTPAGFEQVIIGLARPAEKRELPPPMEGPPDQTMVDKLFNNYWSAGAADHWARFFPAMGMR
jgi:hypothetical protein